MFEIGEDVLGSYLSVGSWVFHPEVVADADMVLDSVVVEDTVSKSVSELR